MFITKYFKINVQNISAFFQFRVHHQANEHGTGPQSMKTDRLSGLWYYSFFHFGALLEFKIIVNDITFHLLFNYTDENFEILMHIFIF